MNDGRCRYSGVQREMVLDFFEFVGFDEPGKEGNCGKATAGCSSLSLSLLSLMHSRVCTHTVSLSSTNSFSLSAWFIPICACVRVLTPAS